MSLRHNQYASFLLVSLFLGGSISHGHGASKKEVTGWVPVLAKWLTKAFSNSTVRNGSIPGTPSVGQPLKNSNIFFLPKNLSNVVNTLTRTFHDIPYSDLTLEFCVSISMHDFQAYMVVCLDMSVDQDVDIVFSEYILNDGRASEIVSDRTKEYERLVRRVMSLPNRPPFIMMQVRN